jgi:hypothetical protein
MCATATSVVKVAATPVPNEVISVVDLVTLCDFVNVGKKTYNYRSKL